MYKPIELALNLMKIERFDKEKISDFSFVFNTKFTPNLLMIFAILLSTMDVLRTSIDCYTDMSANGRKAIMDNFCWSMGTYTCKNQTNGCFNPPEENKIYQRYYQWISLLFIAQACVLYMPSYLWTRCEGGLIHKLCNELGKITSN